MRKTIRRWYDRLPADFRTKIRYLLPPQLLRWYAHQQTDVYLLSYPKSGRTWLRLMLGKAISTHYALPEEEDLLFLRTNRKIHSNVPCIAVIHDDNPMLKSPDELVVSKKFFRGNKVILLVRDPRDVVVSSYFEMKKRSSLFGDNPRESKQMKFDGELSDFIRAEVGSFDTILAYYRIWAINRHIPRDFLLVRYEDLQARTASELRRVLDFIELHGISDETIAAAVEFSTFENMRRMEVENRFKSGILNPGDTKDQNSFKTRSGKISGYRDYLSSAEIADLNSRMAIQLPEMYGYFSE